MSGHARVGCASRGRGRGKNPNSGHLAPSTTVVADGDLLPTPSPAAPPTSRSTARCAVVPSPEPAAPAILPAVGTRRSARLVGKPQRSHVISFPQITYTEGDEDEDEDGLEYDFRRRAEEF